MSEVILHKGVHYNHGLYGYVVQFFMSMSIIKFVLYVLVMSLFGYYISKKVQKGKKDDKF